MHRTRMSNRSEILNAVTALCAIEQADLGFYSVDGYANFYWQSRPGVFARPILLRNVRFSRWGRPVNCAEERAIPPGLLTGVHAVAAEIKINDTGIFVSNEIPRRRFRTEFDSDIVTWMRAAVMHTHALCEAASTIEQQRIGALHSNVQPNDANLPPVKNLVEHPALGQHLFSQIE